LALLLCFSFAQSAVAQQDSSEFTLSMPVEYVNYTIVSVNGSLWAKIDGTYPIHINGNPPDVLPMLYPTPPQTTNIHLYLDGKELPHSNYTEQYPYALHHTAIGDWEMVATAFSPSSDEFLLKIHYEHPLQMVNGSFLFLYDLNISPYLSAESPNSTAYFTVRMETNVTNIEAYTTETDTKWNPINYSSTKDGSVDVISIVMHSEYDKPLMGDLVVEFSSAEAVPEFSVFTLLLLAAVLSGVFVVAKSSCKRFSVGCG